MLQSLICKDWTNMRQPTSYIVSALTGHAKHAAAIAALPRAALQLPPSLQDGLEQLYTAADIEEWQLDPHCIVALLEMPLRDAKSRLDYLVMRLERMVSA